MTRGKAAHGSRPELGRNAVHLMARSWICSKPITPHNSVADAIRCSVAARSMWESSPAAPAQHRSGSMQYRDRPAHPARRKRKRPSARKSALLAQHGLKTAFASIRGGPCPALQTDVRLPLVRALLAVIGRRAHRRRLFLRRGGPGPWRHPERGVRSRETLPRRTPSMSGLRSARWSKARSSC
jgi:hypothetical protein